MAQSQVSRPPALQARSKETRQRILEASLRILAESGVEGLSTQNVSGMAGMSVGSIYRRFGNKEQLLLATQAEFLRIFLGDFEQSLGSAGIPGSDAPAPADATGAIRLVVAALVGNFERHARAMRVLMLLGLQNPQIFAGGQAASIAGGRMYAEVILPHRGEIRRPNPEWSIDYTYRLIYAACSHRITQGGQLESRRHMSWDELVGELAETVCAYLLGPPRGD